MSGDTFGAGFPIGTISQSSRARGGGEITPFIELRRGSQRGLNYRGPFLPQDSKTAHGPFDRCQALNNFLSPLTTLKPVEALSLSILVA